jgi:hypothetical protein
MKDKSSNLFYMSHIYISYFEEIINNGNHLVRCYHTHDNEVVFFYCLFKKKEDVYMYLTKTWVFNSVFP